MRKDQRCFLLQACPRGAHASGFLQWDPAVELDFSCSPSMIHLGIQNGIILWIFHCNLRCPDSDLGVASVAMYSTHRDSNFPTTTRIPRERNPERQT